jgi:heptosyltransferase-2
MVALPATAKRRCLSMTRFLLIQTAFIGDVILATGLIGKLKEHFPDAAIDFMVRKGNEGVLQEHPELRKLWIWDKKGGKYRHLLQLVGQLRREKYDYVINLQRFATTGLVTVLSGGRQTVGFDKNPFSRFFNKRIPHRIGDSRHEVERNHDLILHLTDPAAARPKVYPSDKDYESVSAYKVQPYICIAPTSVWFTKQFPAEKWVELIGQIPPGYRIYLLGAPVDRGTCEDIWAAAGREGVINLAGQLSLLASAALMQDARMNYVNDSAPMHLASATNAPTCAVFCSTVPGFGFGPLADGANVVERQEPLYCRPCGLHGYRACPEGHFKCARDISVYQLLKGVDS